MVKRAFGGLKVFYVHPQSGSITEVIVESAGRAGKPYYEARLLVRAPSGGLWDILAASAHRHRQDAEAASTRIQKGER